MIYFSAQEEVVEKNSEFEKSDNLKELSKSQCTLGLLKVLLARDLIFLGNLEDKKLIRRMQSLKIVTILMKEVNPSIWWKAFSPVQTYISWVILVKVFRRMQKDIVKEGNVWSLERIFSDDDPEGEGCGERARCYTF